MTICHVPPAFNAKKDCISIMQPNYPRITLLLSVLIHPLDSQLCVPAFPQVCPLLIYLIVPSHSFPDFHYIVTGIIFQ